MEDKIVMFDFNHGTKRIEDCSREELLEVIAQLVAEIENLRKLVLRATEIYPWESTLPWKNRK